MERSTGRKIEVLPFKQRRIVHKWSFSTATQRWGHIKAFHSKRNTLAERMNMILLEKVQCMLSSVGISKSFWAEALTYACYLINKLLSSAIGSKTPMKAWSERVSQDYDSLWIFGCPAYYYDKEDRFDLRARKGMFVGFKKGIKGYKIWDLTWSLSWAEMSRLTRLQWWSLQILNRWRVRRLTGYHSRWRVVLLHRL